MILQSLYQTWIPFIYLYAVGGIFFIVGMYVVIKGGSCNLNKKHHRFWLKTLLGGFLFFMMLHAFLIVSALYL